MRSLAGFAMRGRSQAALVAAGSAVASLVLPLVAVISSAAVALVTLRQGARDGLAVAGAAGLGSAALVWLALGTPWPALGFLAVLWAPLWVLAMVLRLSLSLTLAVQCAALFGVVILAGLHLATDDPAAYWARLLEPLRAGLVEGRLVPEAASRTLVEALSKWMTGAFAASLYVQFVLGLFLGRWWQAELYYPGGFGAEFRELRLPRTLGYATLALFGLLLLQPGVVWGYELAMLIAPLLLIQGLAVVHGVRHRLGAAGGWLIAVYVLLALAMPYAEVLVVGLGLADLWFDVRARVARRMAGGQ
jgi:hypothetical protein